MKKLKIILFTALILSLASCGLPGAEFRPSGFMEIADLKTPESKKEKLGMVYFTSKVNMKGSNTAAGAVLSTMVYGIIKKSDQKKKGTKKASLEDEAKAEEDIILATTQHREFSGLMGTDEYKGHRTIAMLLPEGDYILRDFRQTYQTQFGNTITHHTTTGDIGIPFRVHKGKVTYAGSVYFIFRRASMKIYFKDSFDKAYAELEDDFPTLYDELKGKKQIFYKLPKEEVLVSSVKLVSDN